MSEGAGGLARRGDVLAVMVAVLLASGMVALASDEKAPPGPIAQPVEIELKPQLQHAPAAPGVIFQQGAAGEALKKLIAEHRCLAEVLYFEARGEGEAGMRAVAEVILHRLAEGSHGHTICAVVYEGASQTFCQFTFACDGSLEQPKMPEAWRGAQVLAARLLAGEVPADGTGGATYYHAASMHPTWAPKMERVAQIGHHIFYRERASVAGLALRGSVQ